MEEKQCGLILALDVATPDAAREFLDRLDKATPYVKIGPRLYAMGGLPFVKEIIARGYNVFLDLKLHDIPNTVASAVEPLSEAGLWALTIHTSGGYEMMARSVAMRDKTGSAMKLFGITVLTSLGGELWSDVHPACDMNEALIGRAETAERAGLDGIVCSPLDLELLQGRAKKLLRIVPGIRCRGARRSCCASSPAYARRRSARRTRRASPRRRTPRRPERPTSSSDARYSKPRTR